MGLLEWQNLIFVLPMSAALLYVVLLASGLSFGDHGDVSVEHDLDVGADHDLDAGHDVSGDGDHAGDTGESAHGHPHVLGTLLTLLGVGKVPLSILMLSACLTWGAAGLILNVVLGTASMQRVVTFAALAAVVGTRLLAEGLAVLLPKEESYHTPKAKLVGEVGQVLYTVTRTSGTVRLQDPSGNLVDLDCRTSGEDSIPAGARVVIQEYDPSADVFFVRE
jgi:membrane protein implicated in regulation of membrane protease activity